MDKKTAREWFSYNPMTGILTWRKVRAHRLTVGQEAGSAKKGQDGKSYRHVSLKGFGTLGSHRVIYVWMTGHFPAKHEEIDHIDGNGLNNRWDNLRLVNKSEQHKNRRLNANNKTGAVGVYFDKSRQRYMSHVKVNGRMHNLGRFIRLGDAIAAREVASREHGFHPNHGQARPL